MPPNAGLTVSWYAPSSMDTAVPGVPGAGIDPSVRSAKTWNDRSVASVTALPKRSRAWMVKVLSAPACAVPSVSWPWWEDHSAQAID